MKRINLGGLVLFILVLFLSSVTEAVRFRVRYHYTTYYRYYYYGYTTYTISAGVIAGIVIGSLVGVAVLVGAIVLCCVCCCGNGRGRNRPQGGQIIQTQSGPGVSAVSTNVAYYPTAPGSASYPPTTNQAYTAPPPSYNQVTSEGNVNLGFEDNKQAVHHSPS